MKKRTSIQLSQAAFDYNINQIKQAARTDVAVVIKSNAYGHGLPEIARMAQENNEVSWICTAGIAEALRVRQEGISKPIIALSYLDDSLEAAIEHNIHMGIYTLQDAIQLDAIAQRMGKKAYVHIKIDTGMSRLGIDPEQALSFLRSLQNLPSLEIYGLFTHLCDTPNPDQTFSHQQLYIFDEVVETIKAAGIHIPCIHAQSSSALCLETKTTYSFIRAGAAIYGIWKSDSHKQLIQKIHPSFNLQPIMQWKTKVVQLKHIPQGASVGYDRTWIASRPSVIAIAPIGYYDGYDRGLSNRGVALINNHYAPVVGIVSMNMSAFDVTDIPHVTLESDILLLADIPGITAQECAQSAQLITNSFVTLIHASIDRTIVPEFKSLTIAVPEDENEIRIKAALKTATASFENMV